VTVGNASAPIFNSIDLGTTNSVASSVPASVYGFVIPLSGTYYAYRNGTQTGSQNVPSGAADGGNPLMIGNRNDGAGSGNLFVPEIALFNSVLSTGDRNAVENSQKAYYFIHCTAVAITTPPGNVTACLGDTKSFTVTASCSNLSYQWKKEGVNIGGATSATLSLSNVTSGDAASYTCVIKDACGSSTTIAAILNVNALPATPIITSGTSFCPGGASTQSIAATAPA